MKKFSIAVLAAAASILGFGAAAHAQLPDPYPPTSTVTATPASGPPGYTVTVTITGCVPGDVLTVTLGSNTATVTCAAPAALNATGSAATTIAAPNAVGTYTGTVTGTNFNGSFQIQVVAPTPTLPGTGSSGVSTMTLIALGLFGVGAGLFGVSQVRRRQALSA